ncbi:response regulator transcription factor [Luteitalea sp.]|uniref:response regulator n=1 Tax=Luteitalea sp. TaxID=2004800 RepID=UPI0025C7352D|nr:response regulator transcription factor [Luteitalea sp.]
MMPPRARAGTLRFLIADDHGIVRHGLRELIMDAFHPDVVVEADRGRRVIDEVRAQAWDLVVLDIGLPDMDGLEVLKDLKRIRPEQKVLMLSLQPEEQYAVRALKAQASGYVSKTRAAEDLVAAIQTILDGRTYVSTTLAEHLARNVGRRLDDAQEAALSDRELQVLSLLGRGRSVSQIGDQLSLSVKTVSTYRANLLRKLGLTTTGELIRYAIEHRLTE